MSKYHRLFNHFFKVKRLEYLLNEVWMLHKKSFQMHTELRIAKAIKGFNLIRHEMHHFIKTFFSYLMHEVVEVEWNNFT